MLNNKQATTKHSLYDSICHFSCLSPVHQLFWNGLKQLPLLVRAFDTV